jgi:hypothetical protein
MEGKIVDFMMPGWFVEMLAFILLSPLNPVSVVSLLAYLYQMATVYFEVTLYE